MFTNPRVKRRKVMKLAGWERHVPPELRVDCVLMSWHCVAQSSGSAQTTQLLIIVRAVSASARVQRWSDVDSCCWRGGGCDPTIVDPLVLWLVLMREGDIGFCFSWCTRLFWSTTSRIGPGEHLLVDVWYGGIRRWSGQILAQACVICNDL